MTDIEEFLKARLDEDGELARYAAERAAEWRSGGQGVCGGPFADDEGEVDCLGMHTIVYGEGYPREFEARHIALHDPARVMLEVATKRAILQACRRAPSASSHISAFVRGQDAGYAEALADTLRHLASAYSDHPDYRQEWAL
ncbi:DUF6221 family protein [Rhodococcus sp. JVH1]|uniref:DUF6221 family protein n=1 Tax=Rhodococcus sp. JVH1 TaxID=745408 RepID=UPI00027207F3|nr:DUF6221 family protein [Rhodococcus sp. JVH1]EJJ01024.1 hypothetical protein JVH1_1650 [Rhodococcus sp. JVH1]